MDYVLTVLKLKHYLGTIFIDKDAHLKIEAEDKESRAELENLIQDIIKNRVKITECRYEEKGQGNQKITSHTLYLKEVFPKDGNSYLEGIKDGLRSKYLTAYLLEQKKAQLLKLAMQSQLPEHIKQAVSSHLQDIPEYKIKELIKLFQEEKNGLKKIEENFSQRLRNLRQKHQKELKEMINNIKL